MGTFVIGAIVFGGIGYALHRTYQDFKSGKACGCGCESCPHGLDASCGMQTKN